MTMKQHCDLLQALIQRHGKDKKISELLKQLPTLPTRSA